MTLPVTDQATFAATLVDEWRRAGITDAVVAPGSRSTPLALALVEGGLRVHVVLDERSAGFLALGVGLASDRPAPVLVTSGTAAASLLPAVIEASLSRVPMIACTADRPAELQQVGAPQTIDQVGLYGGYVRWAASVGDLPRDAWRSVAARAAAESVTGPVHLNLGFRDPLVGAPGELPPGRDGGRPWHAVVDRLSSAPPLTMAATALVSGRAGVIIAGSGISDPAAVTELASALGWPVLATPGSGCRGPSPAAVVVSAFDAILRTPLASSLQPDAVLRLGGSPASKVLSGWLESSDAAQVVAAPPGAWPDPERRADLVVHGDPAAVCRGILRDRPAPAPDGWAGRWRSAETAAQQRITAVLSRHDELTEPGVARSLTGALGPEATMLVASSMPIRDVEWYGDPAMHARVLANRGANGIDGLVSTALGVAAGSGGPTVALVGDLAFLHDAGGLLWAASRGVDCTFVVVDNDGGGIFGFLPPAALLEPATFERLFGTPHGLDLAALAAVHGLPVQVVDSAAAVVPAVLESVAAGGVRVVLARTDRTANVAVHDELVDGVAAALEPV